MIHLAATVGDPTSIGPEVAAASLLKFLNTNRDAVVHLFAPRSLFLKTKHSRLEIHDHSPKDNFVLGKPSIHSAARALNDLKIATDSCIEKFCHALVTGPVDKFLCSKVDRKFRGHTEFLQERTKSSGTTMLLSSDTLRVALVTTHIPLKDVSKKISAKKILETAQRTYDYLKEANLPQTLAVCGLNPHASDNGMFGSEEKKIILPAIERLRLRKWSVDGPVSPDSFFHRAEDYGAVICMYHDQGLIPLKMKYFYEAVNITLGLPFLRASVDHGTAFDIAGKLKASSKSYAKALEYACNWARGSSRKSRKSASAHSNSRGKRAQSQGHFARYSSK